MKKYLSSLLVLSQMAFPILVLAQATPDPVVPDPVSIPDPIVIPDPAIDQSIPVADVSVLDTSQVTTSPQDTATDQIASDDAVIEDTTDPQPDEPTLTPTPDPVTPDPTSLPDPVNVVTTVVVPPAPPVIAKVTSVDLEPEKKYTFTLESAIATKEGDEKTKQTLVTDVPTIVNDDVVGSLDISGQCSDPYFVVLIYAGKEDYDQNPSSYIFNKAYECKNGVYSYSLDELPPTIKNGKYYLLIGGQGEKGSWKPITALTPINVQKEE